MFLSSRQVATGVVEASGAGLAANAEVKLSGSLWRRSTSEGSMDQTLSKQFGEPCASCNSLRL